jgi:hypothetical protein
MNNNQEQVCQSFETYGCDCEFCHDCGKQRIEHIPKHTPDPKVEQVLDELTTEIKYPSSTPKVEKCEYCGPICYKGAAHNARVEDNAKVEQVAKRPTMESVGAAAMAALSERDANIASLEKELRAARRSFDALRKADQDSLTEALAAAIEQSQRAEKAECLAKEWIDEYTKLRDGEHIAGYEKELRVYKIAFEDVTSGPSLKPFRDKFLEAARKETENGE